MDYSLRCNSLKCRKCLTDHAVVTTCSHVFCTDCASNFRFSRQGQQNGQQPICPACDILLPNPDDVIVTNLNPAEDYKTSVLSGLSPSVIMECAGRALSFWVYQTTQEIVYQDYLAKNLRERCTNLLADENKIKHAARTDIEKLSSQLETLAVERDNFRRKNEELSQAFREKNRKYLQLQEQYDKLKRNTMLGQVQNAAFDAVEQAVQASATANRFTDQLDNERHEPMMFPQRMGDVQNSANAQEGMMMGPPPARKLSGGNWAGLTSQDSEHQNQTMQTPSTHRQRFSANIQNPRMGFANQQVASAPRMTTPARQPNAGMSGSGATPPGFAGYGMSAGLRVSNPTGININGFARPNIRSRVAQRPATNEPFNRSAPFGLNSNGGIMSNQGGYY